MSHSKRSQMRLSEVTIMANFTYKDDELYHFGTIGMTWGLRKYQYEDGTLTPEGILRYRKGKKEIDKLEERAGKHELNSAKAKYKSAKAWTERTAFKQDVKSAKENLRAKKDREKAEKIRRQFEKDMGMSLDKIEEKYGENAVPSFEYCCKLVDSHRIEAIERHDFDGEDYIKDLFPKSFIPIKDVFKTLYGDNDNVYIDDAEDSIKAG